MLRTTVRINEQSNPEIVLQDLLKLADESGILEQSRSEIQSAFETIVGPLHEKALRIFNAGGQLQVSRSLSGIDYSILFDIHVGDKRGWLMRFLGRLRRR